MRKNMQSVILSSLLLVISVAGQASAQQGTLDGIWQTEGYGYLFDIKGSDVTIYETTSISCLKSGLAAGAVAYPEDGTAEARFPVSIPGFIDASMEVSASTGSTRLFHRTDTNGYMAARKISALPEACLRTPDASAASVAGVFEQTFRDHYIFAPNTWAGRRVALPEDATDQQLFDALTAFLSPFEDSHTALVAPTLNAMYFGAEAATGSLPNELRQAGFGIVDEAYLLTPLAPYCAGMLEFAYVGRGIGYLRVRGFTDFSKDNTPEANAAVLEKALDDIFAPEHGLAALVLDLRDNIGGSDTLALQLAARLATEDYAAYSKQAVVSGEEGRWTEPMATWLEPSTEDRFEGPLAILTGPDTLSAGETFTMALMARTPAPVRIGQATRGAFSDMLPRILPNGWLFALPNEQYLDAAGQAYDKVGIPPHVEIEVFAQPDIEAGKDSVLEAAIKGFSE